MSHNCAITGGFTESLARCKNKKIRDIRRIFISLIDLFSLSMVGIFSSAHSCHSMFTFSPVYSLFPIASLLFLSCLSGWSQEANAIPRRAVQQVKNYSSLPISGRSSLEWKQEADKGDFNSMMKLSRFWLARIDQGDHRTVQGQEARHWVTYWLGQAVKQSHPAPLFYLEKLKFSERDSTIDSDWFDQLKNIIDSCEIRATQGDLESISTLIEYFDSPDQQQFDRWVSALRAKSNLGEGQSQADLARLLLLFPEFQKVDGEALILAEQSASQGNTDGMTIAGKLMLSQEKKDGENEDLQQKGIDLLAKAAEAGHIEAIETLQKEASSATKAKLPWTIKELTQMLCDRNQIEFLTTRGQELVEKNIDAPGGLSMLSRAADQGSFTALDLLSTYYQDNGYNVPESPEKTVEYASRLAKANGIRGLIKMASYYERGFGVPKDEKKAMECVRQAMNQGVPEANVEYARLLMKGIGIPADTEQAFSLLKKIESENPETPSLDFLLGYMYEEGIGTGRNFNNAILYYTKGAHAQDTRAMNNLASMYELGVGIPKNMEKAAEWYLKAANMGNHDAKRNIKKISIPFKPSSPIK